MSDGSNGFGHAAVDELTKSVEGSLPTAPPDGEQLAEEQQKSIFEKITFTWRAEDQAILQRVQAAVDQEFANNFADCIPAFEHLYASVRVPETQVIGNQIMPLLDSKRRQVWKLDEKGRPLEDFNLLTGQDIAEALLNLERIRLQAVPRVSELLSHAIYAKMTAGDMHDDRWWSILDGTVADKTSQSNRESRQDRYHAFFRYCLWLTSKEFLDEVGRLMDRLEKIGTWKSFERK